jgi:pyridoxine 4-dehydrogenase
MNLNASAAGQVTFGRNSAEPITVNRIGLGTNRITDTEQAQAVLKHALKLGVNFVDTAELYQGTQSEEVIGRTLAPYSKGVVIATKVGMSLVDYSPVNDPDYMRNAVNASRARLKLECIPLYQLHRVDPNVPTEQTARVLKEMQDEGKVLHLGLSEVNVDQIEQFRKIIDVVSVQNNYSIAERKYEAVLNYCEKEDIVFIPFFPLAKKKPLGKAHQEVAEKLGATPSQIAVAWLLKRSKVMLPIPGTLSTEHLEQNVAAAQIELSGEDFERLSQQQ